MVKKTATIPLVGAALRRVTAAEVEAGLPSGTYAIAAAEIATLAIPGMESGTNGFIISRQAGVGWEHQEFHAARAYFKAYRYASSTAWGAWTKVS